MSEPIDDHLMLDFGAGRRLERFGPIVLDRPAPAALLPIADPPAWAAATARYERATEGTGRTVPAAARPSAPDRSAAHDLPQPEPSAGTWQPAGSLPAAWIVHVDGLPLELRPAPSGQVGLFPEHAGPARMLAAAVPGLAMRLGRPPEVLNLFAHTGLATLLLARAGARVAHVDASRPAVAWARRNATIAGLAAAPIRWLVEDAAAFTAREVRRGRAYDIVILDPPTYGHAPRGGAWRLDADLGALLADCAALTGPRPGFVLLTAHATGLEAATLREAVALAWGPGLAAAASVTSLGLRRPDGALLPAGRCVIVQA